MDEHKLKKNLKLSKPLVKIRHVTPKSIAKPHPLVVGMNYMRNKKNSQCNIINKVRCNPILVMGVTLNLYINFLRFTYFCKLFISIFFHLNYTNALKYSVDIYLYSE